MSSQIPEDLERIGVWSRKTIKAIWGLHCFRDAKPIADAHRRVIECLLTKPPVSEQVELELLLASKNYEDKCFPLASSLSSKHAVDAVEKCAIVALNSVQGGLSKHLRDQVRDYPWYKWAAWPPEYAELKKELDCLDKVRKDVYEMRDPETRDSIEKVFDRDPVRLWSPPGWPPLPLVIPSPDGELAAQVEHLIAAVTYNRRQQNSNDDRVRTDADDTEAPPLTIAQQEFLRAVFKKCNLKSGLLSQERIGAAIGLASSTVGDRLRELIPLGFFERPQGNKKGCRPTARAYAWLEDCSGSNT